MRISAERHNLWGGVVEYSWTSGATFLSGTDSGNYNAGWFSIVSPFNGNVTTIKLNLGISTDVGTLRSDAFLAISSDLKTETTNFSENDFAAISTNSCGTTEYEVTMNFSDAELVGGATYYCYFVTKEENIYTTIRQRFYVETTSKGMIIGQVGQTSTEGRYTIPFEGTMTLKEDAKYRIKGLWPTDNVDCWLYSNPGNENKLWKKKIAETTDQLTNTRYLWETKLSESVKIMNVGNEQFIPIFTSDNSTGENVDYLSATTENYAANFSFLDRVNTAKIGSVALMTTYNNNNAYLNTYTYKDEYVGCFNNTPNAGDVFYFQQVKTVTFNKLVAVNGEDEVTEIYLAADGSDVITLPTDYAYSVNGQEELNAVEAAAAITAYGSEDITVTVNENPDRKITYNLVWDGSSDVIITEESVVMKNGELASEHLPNKMNNDFATLSYSPEVLAAGTSEITVTATWNGPFQLSNSDAPKYYTVGMHSAHEANNYIWKNNDGSLSAHSVKTDAYAELSNANLFYFSGNPYNGITITSKNGGSVNKVDDQNTQATVGSGDTKYVPVASTENGKTIANGYACFQVKDGNVFLAFSSDNNGVANSGNEAASGSTCWFIPAGQYYLNALDELSVNAPANAVGTRTYLASLSEEEATAKKSEITAQRTAVVGNMYGDIAAYADARTILDEAASFELTTLESGYYYRVVSAVPGFNNTAAWYYNPATDNSHIVWAKEATNDAQQINSLFKFTANGDGWNIYSPNAQNSITTGNGNYNSQNASLGEVAAVTITPLEKAQFNLTQSGNNNPIHALGHSSGTGTSGNLIIWDGGAESASAWYIVKVEEVSVNLNEIGDSYYATLYAPFAYTVEGATAYTLTLNDQRTSLLLHEVEDHVPAGTAVVLISEQNATATLTLDPEHDYAAALLTALTGTYTAQAIPAGAQSSNYFLGKLNDVPGFYKYSGELLNLAANRAYLEMGSENASNGFSLTLSDDDITAIIDAVSSANGAPHYYDLQGRRVAAPQKGRIYIVNGKKTIF